MLKVRTKTRPIAYFQAEHVEATSHMLRIILPSCWCVPVPIGPSIPQQDRDDVQEQYCCLMLILFKPWKHASDLQGSGQTWQSVFEEFSQVCPMQLKSVINDMQILHECQDSQDDHLAE